MPQDKSPDEVVISRTNPVYNARIKAITTNLLATYGGRPYINARLTQFPAEQWIDWAGTAAVTNKQRFDEVTPTIPGRRDRAYNVNHAARASEKIRQFVFASPPERPDAPQELLTDITRRGNSIDQFTGELLKNLVATKWAWIGVDAPSVRGQISLRDEEDNKIRPFWVMYSAPEVVDWRFDSSGTLLWLITEGCELIGDDPHIESQEITVRRLWEPGMVTAYHIKVDENDPKNRELIGKQEIAVSFSGVPFSLAGVISPKPHFYDDVEGVQRAILDLESCLDTLFHKIVFAQPVLPRSVADSMTGENAGTDLSKAVAAVLGYANAILEDPADKGISRYIGPDASGIKAMQEELGRKREALFDTIGLHLGFSQFSKSTEADKFEQLDPEAVLRNYAQMITEAETEAWRITNQWDSSIPAVVPKYANRFNVSNIYEDMKATVLASQIDAPDSTRRLILHATVNSLLQLANVQVDKETLDQTRADIDTFDFSEPIDDMLRRVADGVQKQATDDGNGTRASGAE